MLSWSIFSKIYLFIFLVSQTHKTNLSLKSTTTLTCIKSSGFCPDLHHPFPVSLLYRIAVRILHFFIFSNSFFFLLMYLSLIAVLDFVCVPEIRPTNIHRMLTDCISHLVLWSNFNLLHSSLWHQG